MSHNPGPGTYIPANAWSRTIKVPASMLSGPITSTQNESLKSILAGAEEDLTHSASMLSGPTYPVSEVDLLKEQVEKLTSRLSELEIMVGRQAEQIDELRQNNSRQISYAAPDYWSER